MPPAAGRWTILALLALISAAHQFHRHALPAVGSRIMAEYSIDPPSMGALYSTFLLTYTLMMTPGGWLADRVGTRRTLLMVMAGSSLFTVLTGAAGWFTLGPLAAWWWIAAARGSMGVLSAPLYPSTSRTVASWFHPREQTFANALVTAAAAAGISASFWGMVRLSDRPGLGWRGAFLWTGLAGGLVLILWALVGRSGPAGGPAPPGPRPGSLVRLLRHPGVLALVLSYGALGYFQYIFFYWIPFYFSDVLGLASSESGGYSFLTTISMMVFTPLGGLACAPVIRRWGLSLGLRIVPMACMGLAGLFLVAGALVTQLPLAVAALSLALGFLGASEGPFWTASVRLGGRLGATSAGLMNTGGNLGGLLSPWLTPTIAVWVNASWDRTQNDPLGWKVAFIIGSAICLTGMLFWLRVDGDRPFDEEVSSPAAFSGTGHS